MLLVDWFYKTSQILSIWNFVGGLWSTWFDIKCHKGLEVYFSVQDSLYLITTGGKSTQILHLSEGAIVDLNKYSDKKLKYSFNFFTQVLLEMFKLLNFVKAESIFV